MEQAAGLEIRDVLDLPGDLFRTIRAGNGEPDSLDVARGLHHGGHGLSPFWCLLAYVLTSAGGIAPAASVMAASILVYPVHRQRFPAMA
jgi:hypothetical protein